MYELIVENTLRCAAVALSHTWNSNEAETEFIYTLEPDSSLE